MIESSEQILIYSPHPLAVQSFKVTLFSEISFLAINIISKYFLTFCHCSFRNASCFRHYYTYLLTLNHKDFVQLKQMTACVYRTNSILNLIWQTSDFASPSNLNFLEGKFISWISNRHQLGLESEFWLTAQFLWLSLQCWNRRICSASSGKYSS